MSSKSEVGRYLEVFPEMRVTTNQCFDPSRNVPTRALWATMIALQTKRVGSESSKRVVFCDNYYTFVDLGVRLLRMTDGEIRLCGTIRISYLEAENKRNVTEAISQLNNGNRHAYFVEQAKWKDTEARQNARRRRRAVKKNRRLQ